MISFIEVLDLSQRTIGLIPAEHGTDDARKLVGHRSNHDVEGPSGDQAIDPCPEAALTASRKPDQRSCAVHQLSAQIAVTPFADPEQPFPTTGRVLARRETEPRGKAAAVREDLRVDDRRYHRCRDYGADTRDRCQPPGGLVVTSLPQRRPSRSVIFPSIARRCST